MKSSIFYSNEYKNIEVKTKTFLNNYQEFLNEETVSSTRATGDATQTILEENFNSILGDLCEKYSPKFARRAMADLDFTDRDNFYYMIDVKTHRLSTKFNMPNLTSVERLTRFYEDDTNFEFYPREIGKIKSRIEYFKKAMTVWKNKEDIWV